VRRHASAAAQCRLVLRFVPVALAAVVIVSFSSGAGAQPGKVPTQLLGNWKRTVSSADVTRSGTGRVPAGTMCTLTIDKRAVLNVWLSCPSLGDGVAGTVRSIGVGRVDMNVAAFGPTVYSWRVSGRSLTLTKIRDGKPIRVAVLWGVWTRK
jgi:hypothetical protein